MIIQSIELNNFRNYENLQISFDEGTNILFGDNAQGKTNILGSCLLKWNYKVPQGKQRQRDDPFWNKRSASSYHGFKKRQTIPDRHAFKT